MPWLRMGILLAFQLAFATDVWAQEKHQTQVFFDGKIPDVGLLRPLKSQPVALHPTVIDALRSGRLPNERLEPVDPRKQPPPSTNDNQRNRRSTPLGAFEIYPQLDKIGEDKSELEPKAVLDKVRGQLEKTLLPRDSASETKLEWGKILSRMRSDADKPQRKLLYISARRSVDGIPVDGPGSRFVVAFDANANLVAMVYNWSSLQAESQPVPARVPASEARNDIVKQIRETFPRGNVHVQRVDVVYYDYGGDTPLTPSYRFVAEVERNKDTAYTTEHLVGFVPLIERKLPPRRLEKNFVDKTTKVTPRTAAVPPGALLLGRFVAREDSAGFLTGANDFLSALTTGSVPGGLTFADAGGAIAATSNMFGVDKDDYVNSVDVALVEAHGIPLGFTTRRDAYDPVYIEEDVKAPGLGAGSGGKLKHWVLHSCRAIPAPTDIKVPWFPLWKNVFNGVSSVVGYRTPMFIADHVELAFGESLRAGKPVVPAWFNAVSSASIYGLDVLARFQCENTATVGRPSAVVACGSEDSTANEGATTPTNCLEMWWIEDELINFSSAGVAKP